MKNENLEQLKMISQIFNTKSIVTPEQVQQVLKGIVTILGNYRQSTNTINTDTKKYVSEILDKVIAAHEENEGRISKYVETKHGEMTDRFDSQVSEIKSLFSEIMNSKPKDGKPGNSPKIEDIVPEVMKAIKLPENEIETGATIADKLETLEGSDRLKASAIEESSFVDFIKSVIALNFNFGNSKRVNTVGGGVQSITSKDGSLTINSSGAKAKGVVDLSVAIAGSGITFEQPLGNVDNSNVTFTVVNTPKFINVNGAIYGVGQGQYVSLTPGTPKTITLANPVGTGGFIGSYY